MLSSILYIFFAFLQLCNAISSPDIYALTQPADPSPDLGEDSQPATVPSTSRHGSGPSSGLNIYLPDYEADPNWLPLVLSLKTIGLQVNVIDSLEISSQCRNLLIYTSPDVSYTPSSADVETLTSFVGNGGHLILMNQVPTALYALAGVTASTIYPAGSRSALQLSNAETTVQALQGLDFSEFYDVNLAFYDNATSTGLVNVGYTPAEGSQTLGKYLVRSGSDAVDTPDTSTTNVGFIKNQPSNSTGAVYSFGLDLGYLYIEAQAEGGDYAPWYDGHYYPGYDIGTRIIKNIVTSSSHFVSLWTVPYNKGLAFTTTWDIDTYVSYPHGQGMAAAAQDRGAGGNLNLHTKYATDAYERAYFQYGVPYIYQITGFRTAPDGFPYIDFGSHSVSHSPNANDFPYGTTSEQFIQGTSAGYDPTIHQCSNTTSDGTPTNGEECIQGGTSGLSFWTLGGTASGEVRVSAYLIRYLLNDVFKTDYNLTAYRPGNLAWNKFQSTHCVANGFIGGSSCAGNFHLTHLPFQVTHNREPFQELPYYEFPLQWSDGDGNMSSADFPGSDFNTQVKQIKQMARYGGHYNILLHPSDGVFDKIQIQRALHDAVRPYAVFFNQTGIAHWWTNRDRTFADITAADSESASMTVHLDGRTEGLTLQVPRTYTFQSSTGSLSVCQQPSFDNATNAVILRNTAEGDYNLTFSVGSTDASVSNCPDFTPQPASECIAWDVAIDDFLELWFYDNEVNLLILETSSTGLASNNVNGTLQLTATSNTGVNSYYSEVSRFCFDATLYTHLYFDMVAPAGSTFYVQLVSYDDACNFEQPSATYLDVTKYAAADGQNHTVAIPLTDFAGQDLVHVRGIRIGNIAPANTPVYIDNLKIQKRCVTAPGEDFTQGLAIESFQVVDRWVTGINNIFGETDYDNSMTFAKLSELGKMQLLPADSESYFYTSTAVDGVNLNASSYSAVSLNVRGPAGGSFDVVVTSGADSSNSTVSTSSYTTISQDRFSNVTIPMSAFSGLDASSLNRITLQNFAPYGGSAASNFTVRWISLLGGPKVSSEVRCTSASGYVVLDFCNTDEFTTQTNALGAPFSDDNTMQSYNQNDTTSGYINLVPSDATSYFYSQLAQSSGCAALNSSYDSLTLTVSGPEGSTADVGFKYGGATCDTNVVTSLVSVSFNAAMTTITVPFSRFPSGFNQEFLQSFIMTNFSSPGGAYQLYSVSFEGPKDSPGCALCSGTIVDTCTYVSTLPTRNSLDGVVSDESSLTSYAVGSDGSLSLGTNSASYWYTTFGSSGCYNAKKVNATGVQLSLAAPANTSFDVILRWMSDDECTTVASPVSVPITSYVSFTSESKYQTVQIPFSDFPGVNTSSLNSVAVQSFSPADVTVNVGCVSLITVDMTPDTKTCSTCPDTAWLNYCVSGVASRNAYGGVQSDDGTMTAAPAIQNGSLSLQPAGSTSYWYSLQSCIDVSSSPTLYLNVSANAGSSFDIQLQSSSNGCADSSQLQRAQVSSASYGVMTGGPVVLSIPLEAYTDLNSAFSASSLYAVVLENFSDASGAYVIHCAYFGNGTTTSTMPQSTIQAVSQTVSQSQAETTSQAPAQTTSQALGQIESSASAQTTSTSQVTAQTTSNAPAQTTMRTTTSQAAATTTSQAQTQTSSIKSTWLGLLQRFGLA
ncbi:hypothetical protein F4778DRAFT_576451 [Xylariomycetidae sp. FL2044]|nr:hypothetical protein F4778DRAFT_576451 [Xylariomycetidae sp. FL2044]